MNIRTLVFFALSTIPAALAAQSPTTTPASPAVAANQPTREQLLTLFQVMRIRAQMEEMLKSLPQALEEQMHSEEAEVRMAMLPMGGEPTAEQSAALDRITQKYFVLAEKQYPVDEMLEELVRVYQRHLTRADVDGILAFYRSTPGQHLLDAEPLMAKEAMPEVMKKQEARDHELVERYKKELGDVFRPAKSLPTAPKS